MNNKIALVIEGGGFRGMYSAGILDYFLENNIEFPYAIGVSMGACNGVNYISKQIGRNLSVPYTYINDKRYMSYQRLFVIGELFGMDFIFGDVPKKLIPFDFETFQKSPQKFIAVATDCNTGEPVYMNEFSSDDLLMALKASTSLPFASKMICYDNKELLDGGISDPIPVNKALRDGNEKVVVILTQPKEYRKKPSSFNLLGTLKYIKYPKLIQALNDRYKVYNDTLDQIEELERQGKAFVIRPKRTLPINRTEKNKEKLKAAFDIGYKQSNEFVDELRLFMS
ncbi:patatin family protein [Labilibacter sediminis]|nr:patatin family protein [Labilibacter sediminis]